MLVQSSLNIPNLLLSYFDFQNTMLLITIQHYDEYGYTQRT